MARVVKKRKQQAPARTPLEAMLEEHLLTLATRNYSHRTLTGRRFYISSFIQWCQERGLTEPHEVTRPVLERYQRHLFHYRKKNGEPLSFTSQHAHQVPLRVWFKWMTRQNYILHNPASELELPRLGFRLPPVLTAGEAELVMQQPNLADPAGVRDRAILEMLYSTGIRRTELVELKLPTIDRERGIITIYQGKGNKDRVVPIGERALAWLDKYVREARPKLVVEPDDGTVFLTIMGEPFSPNHMTAAMRVHVEAAKISKRGACHLFRHTMATLMLEGGADIRFIQQMLGHSDLTSTSIYTRVSIRALKQIHAATHPGALLKDTSHPDHQQAVTAVKDDAELRTALLQAIVSEDDHD